MNSLKDEIKNSQTNYKKVIAEKDKQIEDIGAQLAKRRPATSTTHVSSAKTMTGLPVNLVKEKKSQSGSLKFKAKTVKKEEAGELTPSASSAKNTPSTKSTAPSLNQFSDLQLAHDNQMLTNELIVLNRDLKNTKSELKKIQEAHKKTEKERDAAKKNAETLQGSLDKLRRDRD